MTSTAIIAPAVEQVVLLGTADEAINGWISEAILGSGRACRFVRATTLEQVHEALRSGFPCVALVDERIVGGAPLGEALLRFTEHAPVALIAAPEKSEEVCRWVARGEVEFIARVGDFVALAAAVLIRRMRWAEEAESVAHLPWKELPADFAAILRHEINNPLTGILGNAELLLVHHRDKLPAGALQRIETVIDLAVRLRESTRRLSNAVETGYRQARSA